MSRNNVKEWFLGFVTPNSPMGRWNYFLSSLFVSFLLPTVCFFVAFFCFVVLKMDEVTVKILLTAVFGLLYLYFRYNLMCRRIWHITEEIEKGRTYSFVISVFWALSALPFLGLLVGLGLFVVELILIFKSGEAIPEDKESENNYNF